MNSNGEVIGINTAKVATDSVEGMGYAIPISDASDTIQNLMNQETKTKVSEAEQGYLGIQGVDVSDESAKMYNMPTGVYISDVVKLSLIHISSVQHVSSQVSVCLRFQQLWIAMKQQINMEFRLLLMEESSTQEI